MAPQEIAANLRVIKAEASTPGVKKSFALFNNHGRANSAANAIMLSQELGVRLKAMPCEAMVLKFPDLVQGREAFLPPGAWFALPLFVFVTSRLIRKLPPL